MILLLNLNQYSKNILFQNEKVKSFDFDNIRM